MEQLKLFFNYMNFTISGVEQIANLYVIKFDNTLDGDVYKFFKCFRLHDERASDWSPPFGRFIKYFSSSGEASWCYYTETPEEDYKVYINWLLNGWLIDYSCFQIKK